MHGETVKLNKVFVYEFPGIVNLILRAVLKYKKCSSLCENEVTYSPTTHAHARTHTHKHTHTLIRK